MSSARMDAERRLAHGEYSDPVRSPSEAELEDMRYCGQRLGDMTRHQLMAAVHGLYRGFKSQFDRHLLEVGARP
ncbi:hypothetical protein ACFSZS_03430 [Seohaeicola zhoushanensis]